MTASGSATEQIKQTEARPWAYSFSRFSLQAAKALIALALHDAALTVEARGGRRSAERQPQEPIQGLIERVLNRRRSWS